MVNQKASVSVVIPCYRNAETILRAVNSVANQTLRPAELILVDDASGDETLTILQQLATKYPDWIKLISLKINQGAANARNIGWEKASQKYIAFLDADDAWHPEKIEIQFNYMNKHQDVVLNGHGHCVFDADSSQHNWKYDAWQCATLDKKKFLMSNQFVTPSVMILREISQRFTVDKRHMEDHMLWLEIIYSGAKVTKAHSKLAAIYKPSFGWSGLSAQLWKMQIGDFSNYVQLYSQHHISLLQCVFFLGYSLLKFVRRLSIYSLNTVLKKYQ